MKKLTFIFTLLIILSMAVVMVVIPSQSKGQNKTVKEQTNKIPDNINKIVQNSCAPCHMQGGKGMALAHLNFSNWETYSPEKQADKAASVCKQLTKGSMPPKGFKASHPDAVPTAEQIKAVCDWADSLKKK
ncbi:MAG: heme-binding domain-containing protein [Bacteroidetes bacterium]|nr:heme-binding domain-containing protein [Bacteroidota bacterium]